MNKMTEHYSKSFKEPFIISEEQLRRLYNLFKEGTLPTIRAKCSDNTDRIFENIESLIAYENAKNSKILEIRIKSTDDTFLSLTFDSAPSTTFISDSISIEIHAETEEKERIQKTVENIISGMRPWYYPIANLNFLLMYSGIFFAFIFVIFMYSLYTIYTLPTEEEINAIDNSDIPPSIGMLFLIVKFALLSLPIIAIISIIKNKIFPYGVFLIGQEKDKHMSYDVYRILFLSSVVIPIIISPVIALIF